jgi:hypothetical protein
LIAAHQDAGDQGGGEFHAPISAISRSERPSRKRMESRLC